jgi:scyllo-inositol 2-dehydrogenase (NADP+)
LDLIECAIICTPEDLKFDLIYFFLRNKKHVLVEKPLLLPLKQLKELDELAKKNSLALKVAYNLRFEYGIQKIKRELRRGEIGKVYIIKAFYGNGTARNIKSSSWRDNKDAVTTDLLSHLIDLMYFLLGDQELIIEYSRQNSIENLGSDHSIIIGKMGKVVIILEASYLSWQNRFSLQLVGEKGSLNTDGLSKWKNHNFEKHIRVLPSGPPIIKGEKMSVSKLADELQWEEFKEIARNPAKLSLEKEMVIARVLSDFVAMNY